MMLPAILALMLGVGAGQTQAQAPATPANSASSSAPIVASAAQNTPAKSADPKQNIPAIQSGAPLSGESVRQQRQAARFYLDGVHLIQKQRPEDAWKLLRQAKDLQPDNQTYAAAAALAEQSAVTRLVEQSSQARINGNLQAASELLRHAFEIDPDNPSVQQHLSEMNAVAASSQAQASQATAQAPQPVTGRKSVAPVSTTAASPILPDAAPTSVGRATTQGDNTLAEGIKLAPAPGKQSFHLRSNEQQIIQQVFHAYGIESTVHDSVPSKLIRLDIDDATFMQAVRVLSMLTQTFYEPLDPHRVLVAQDTQANRTLFQRMQVETVYLPGLTEKDFTDVSNLAKNVFDATQSVAEPTAGTFTLRAPARNLEAFNQTLAQLENGQGQLDLDVKVIQLAHVADRQTGTSFFQQTSVYNVFSEINSVLSQNQSLVQQIISSGLVANDSTLANQIEILAILVASGQLTGTPFNQGFLPFGGGLTQSILSPGPATLNMTLNSSDTRTLDDIHMRLQDDEPGTFRTGERYPIETSAYSSVALPSSLSGLSSAITSAEAQTIPQIQYEDLGLTLKATPKLMRSDDVAITLDLKIEALGGTSINAIPILDSRQISGVLTLKAGETAILISDLSKTETRALSGLPGVSDIPGLEDASDITRDQNVARLLILITPSVVRGMNEELRSPMLLVDKAATAH